MSVPWSAADVRFAASSVVAAALLTGAGWWRSSGAADLDDAVTGLVLAVAGVVVIIGGMLSWFSSGRKAVCARSIELLACLEPPIAQPSGGVQEGAVKTEFVEVAGSRRFHRSDCLLVRHQATQPLHGEVRQLRRRVACEMCNP